MFKFESGSFIVSEGMKFKPGVDPLLQDHISMGQSIGKNIMILYRAHDNVNYFEVVNTNTGDSLNIKILDYDKDFKDYYQKLTADDKAEIAAALASGHKIEAIKIVRRVLNICIKEGKAFIDSKYFGTR
jgi:hypothetical protein